MKRILIFSLNYYPFVGGAEVAIREITNRIPLEEIEFHLIAYRFDSTLLAHELVENVHVHRIGLGKPGMTVSETFAPLMYLGKVLYVPLATLTALRLHRKYRFDAFWSMMTYMVFPVAILRLLGIRLPYAVTLQEGDPFERVFERWRIRLVGPLLFYGLRHATVVQAISSFLAAWARRCGYDGEVVVVPNGVDTARFAQVAPRGISSKAVTLVTTSRLVRKNGIDTVIQALPLLPQAHFVVYGSGPEEGRLRALTKEMGVEDRVEFRGYIGHEEMPAALAACDIFIRPSRSEGMGNSFIEAMAAGLPVIATQEGGIADFLFDEKRDPDKETTGWAVDSDSSEQIAEALQDIVSSPEKVGRVTAAARKVALEGYSWDLVGSRMQEVFRKLLVQ